MLRTLRFAAATFALATATSLAGCAAEAPSEPASGSPLNGNWVGDYGNHEIQLTLNEHDGAVTGSGKYFIGTAVHPVAVSGTAAGVTTFPGGDAAELDFAITVTGEGVPTTTIKGTTSHSVLNGEPFEVLPSYVSNAAIGSDVYILFARP